MASLNLKEDGLQCRLAVCEAGEVSPMKGTTRANIAAFPPLYCHNNTEIFCIFIYLLKKSEKHPNGVYYLM